jgi:aspartate aminotransferase-like enzyme
VAAGGQGALKGKIVRLGHLGHAGRFDVLIGIAALEMALRAEGWAAPRGAGVAAAMEILEG